MTYNELAELFKREGGDAQVCFSVISQNQILFGNNDTKKDIISFKNEEPIKWVKEVQEEPMNIWHDASEKSNEPEDVVIINPSDNTGEVLTRCIDVYQGRIWAYTSELLKLDNPCKIGKNCKEKLVSECLGKVGSLKSHEYYPEKKTTNKTSKGVFDANMPRRKAYLRGFKDGAHAHKELIANKPVSEELEDAASSFARKDSKGINNPANFYYTVADKARIFKAGANWQKENLWNPADGDDLPEYEREVVVFTQNYPDDAGMMMVAIGHRPNPEGFDGKSLTTGEVEHYIPKTYDKGGWNIPNVVLWLDAKLPKEIEL